MIPRKNCDGRSVFVLPVYGYDGELHAGWEQPLPQVTRLRIMIYRLTPIFRTEVVLSSRRRFMPNNYRNILPDIEIYGHGPDLLRLGFLRFSSKVSCSREHRGLRFDADKKIRHKVVNSFLWTNNLLFNIPRFGIYRRFNSYTSTASEFSFRP